MHVSGAVAATVRSETYEVAGDKVLVVEAAVVALCEDVEVLGQGDEHAEEERNARADEAKRRRVRQLVVGDALGPARAHKVDVRDEERDPGQEAEDGRQVD